MSVSEHLEALCQLGHRGSTTSNEREASQYIRIHFEALGLETAVEEFRSHTSFSWVFMAFAGVFALISLLAFKVPSLALLLAIVLIVFLWGECTSRFKTVSSLMPQGPSQNVLARKPLGSARQKLVVVAHYDSSKSGMMFSPNLVGYFRSLSTALAATIVVLTLIMLIRFFGGGGSILSLVQWIGICALVGAAALLVERELNGEYVQGASDNASGTAVLLDLAETLTENPLKDTEVWFLATGCEEVNVEGMLAFWNAHASEFDTRSTFFLNIDNVGSGNLHYIVGEGMLKVYHASPRLIFFAEEVAKGERFADVHPLVYRVLPTDALVPASRGFPFLSLMGLDERGLPVNWHWPTDNLENADINLVEKTCDFANELIRLMDEHG